MSNGLEIVDQTEIGNVQGLLQFFLVHHPGEIGDAGTAVHHRTGHSQNGPVDENACPGHEGFGHDLKTGMGSAGKGLLRDRLVRAGLQGEQRQNGFGSANIAGKQHHITPREVKGEGLKAKGKGKKLFINVLGMVIAFFRRNLVNFLRPCRE